MNKTYIINFLNENYIDTSYYQSEESIEEGYTVVQLDKMSAEELIEHLDLDKLLEEEELEVA